MGNDKNLRSSKDLEYALSKNYNLPEKPTVFNKVDFYLLENPAVSTWLVAFCLAAVWLATWLLVLFLVTYSSGSATSAYVLVAGLLLSTVAEAIIRLCENHWRLERWSRGILHREIDGLNLGTAFAWVLLGVILIILLPDLTTIQDEVDFNLNGMPKGGKIPDMIMCWGLEFQEHPKMKFYIIGSLVIRTIIYKRKHTTVIWKEAALHIQEAKAKLAAETEKNKSAGSNDVANENSDEVEG